MTHPTPAFSPVCRGSGLLLACTGMGAVAVGAGMPQEKSFTNTLGMSFVRIEPGRFQMGFESRNLPAEMTNKLGLFPQGDFDERPEHEVRPQANTLPAIFSVRINLDPSFS